MLQHRLHPADGILVVEPSGPLSAADFEALAATVDAHLERSGQLRGLLIRAGKFPGWKDFAGLVEHIRFVHDHHRAIDRVAFCSDSPVAEIAPRLAGHFVNAEVRQFPFDEEPEALAWLKEPGTASTD